MKYEENPTIKRLAQNILDSVTPLIFSWNTHKIAVPDQQKMSSGDQIN